MLCRMTSESISAVTTGDLSLVPLKDLLNPIMLVDTNGTIHYCNRSARKLFPADPLQQRLGDMNGGDHSKLSNTLRLWAGSSTPRPGTLDIPGPGNSPQRLKCYGSRSTMNAPSGDQLVLIQCHDTPSERLGILRTTLKSLQDEVTERRRAQALAEEALRERDLMLRELQHRVKNNIQVVTSLVRSSIRETKSAAARAILEETYSRLAAATAVQQLLYQTGEYQTIDASHMVHNLVAGLGVVIGKKHVLKIHADAVHLPNNAALPIGLIINELMTNSIKYGRNSESIAEVDISLTREGNRIKLLVADTGPGFEFQEPTKKATGLGLVRGLVRQLNGSMKIETLNGAQTTIRFEVTD